MCTTLPEWEAILLVGLAEETSHSVATLFSFLEK